MVHPFLQPQPDPQKGTTGNMWGSQLTSFCFVDEIHSPKNANQELDPQNTSENPLK